MPTDPATRCPHCDSLLVRWANPSLANWSGPFQWVCFDDACPYYVRGWDWMRQKFNVNASYRHRLDPTSGETGPLPVWSEDALRSGILGDEAL